MREQRHVSIYMHGSFATYARPNLCRHLQNEVNFDHVSGRQLSSGDHNTRTNGHRRAHDIYILRYGCIQKRHVQRIGRFIG